MRILFYITIFLAFSSCKKQEIGPQCISCEETQITINKETIIVVNEGNFMWGNSSISLYNTTSKTISNNVFFQVNGYGLGDVAQSMTVINDKGYIVVNNSSKVEVVDISTFSSIGQISGLTSPRYVLPINSNLAYVTDLYANKIHVVDYNNYNIVSSINVNGWCEELIKSGNYVYTLNHGGSNLYKIDVNFHQVVDSLSLAKGPSGLVLDVNNNLWVLSNGGSAVENPELVKIDLNTFTVLLKFVFPNINQSPSRLVTNKQKDNLYYIDDNDVYKINTNASTLPLNPLFSTGNTILYNIFIDDDLIYLTDAIDYVQQGNLLIYNQSGVLKRTFKTGIIPSYMSKLE